MLSLAATVRGMSPPSQAVWEMLAVAKRGFHVENLILPAGVIAVLVICRLALDWLDRGAIRDAVARYKGSQIISIHLDPVAGFFSRARARYYDVVYQMADGSLVDARCTATFFGGLEWISDTPVGRSIIDQPPEDLASEPCACLECGATIPAATTRCSRCGWSYRK